MKENSLSFKIEMPVPCRFRTQISPQGDLRGTDIRGVIHRELCKAKESGDY